MRFFNMAIKLKAKRFNQGLKTCYSCNKTTVIGNYCSECGDITGVSSVEIEYRTCHYCGEEIPDRNYCIYCGHRKQYDVEYEKTLETLSAEFKKSIEEEEKLR